MECQASMLCVVLDAATAFPWGVHLKQHSHLITLLLQRIESDSCDSRTIVLRRLTHAVLEVCFPHAAQAQVPGTNSAVAHRLPLNHPRTAGHSASDTAACPQCLPNRHTQVCCMVEPQGECLTQEQLMMLCPTPFNCAAVKALTYTGGFHTCPPVRVW